MGSPGDGRREPAAHLVPIHVLQEGVDVAIGGRPEVEPIRVLVQVEDEERPLKWPGVHVFGARVSFRARGGALDWLDLLGGVGRALAASHQPPHRRDAAFGHALGWLLSSLLFEPRWLAGVAGVALTAGASAPEVLVERVSRRLQELGFARVEEVEVIPEDVRFTLPAELAPFAATR